MLKLIRKIILWAVIVFFGSSLFFVIIYRFVPVPVTPLMIIRLVQQSASGETVRLHHHWVPLRKMSKYMPVAVMASEDQRFLKHHGFDFKEIGNAIGDRLDGRRKRGGSTISQQTAKNVFLWPESSWTRKGFEVYFTVLIEFFWSKQRIMEVYLNSIEMGHGIYGVEAVARDHFHTTAQDLSRSQCALIAATLPNPLRYNSAYPSTYLRKRQLAIENQMRHINLFTTVRHTRQTKRQK